MGFITLRMRVGSLAFAAGGSRDSDDGSSRPAYRSARLSGRRGRAAPSLCSNASVVFCSCNLAMISFTELSTNAVEIACHPAGAGRRKGTSAPWFRSKMPSNSLTRCSRLLNASHAAYMEYAAPSGTKPRVLRRHPGQRPCHKRHFARSSPRTATSDKRISAAPRHLPPATRVRNAPRHAASRARPWRSAANSRCRRHNPASPSLSTVAGVSAVTPATASACLNASDTIVGPLRAKAKRDWFPSVLMTLQSNHFKMTLVLAVSAADIAAIKPNNDELGWRHRRLRRSCDIRLHNRLADPCPSCSAPCPRSSAPQIGSNFGVQQVRDLAGAAPAPHTALRRHIGEFGAPRSPASRVEGGRSSLLPPSPARDR